MASLRERLERQADGIGQYMNLPTRNARKVLALLAAAKRALHFVEMVGAFGLHADMLAALAAFEEERT